MHAGPVTSAPVEEDPSWANWTRPGPQDALIISHSTPSPLLPSPQHETCQASTLRTGKISYLLAWSLTKRLELNYSADLRELGPVAGGKELVGVGGGKEGSSRAESAPVPFSRGAGETEAPEWHCMGPPLHPSSGTTLQGARLQGKKSDPPVVSPRNRTQ